MADQLSVCQHCGAPRKPEVRFCGQCGKPNDPVAAAAPVAAAPKSAPSKKTMMGFQSPVAGVAPPEAANPATARSPVAHFQPVTPSAPIPPVVVAPSVPTAPASAKGKTMLGIPAAVIPSAASAPSSPTPAALATPHFSPAAGGPAHAATGSSPDNLGATRSSDAGHAKTMLGINAAALPPARGATPVFTPPAGSAAFAQTAIGGGVAVNASDPMTSSTPGTGVPAVSMPAAKMAAGRTMLGVSTVAAPQVASQSPRAAIPQGRTMLGVTPGMQPVAPSSSAAGFEPTPMDTSAPGFSQTGGAYYDEPAAVSPKRGSMAAIVVGVLLVVLVGAAGLYLMMGREHVAKVHARVVAADNGDEAMQFEVAGAVAGAKIRFGGQERVLEAGRVVFPLAKDSLRVGDNVVLVDLLEPDGEVTPERITLAVDFRIRSDTSPLTTDPAAIDVVVSALPGTKVTLDGEALELDAAGKGVKRYPIEVATQANAGVIDHSVKYRVQPPTGEATVGELVTKIPLATLQIDRPGITVVTDKAEVEIAGAVSPAAKLTVDGASVPVNAGRFLYRMALPEAKEYAPRVVASEPGKAPYGVSLQIRRVADLAQEALSFVVDPSLTYARISQNTSIYKGQKAAFEGRVYNVTVQGGRSVIQMLARDCPEGARCSLWVTYPAATDATVNSWIRVLGTLDGEQQFRSESNEVKTVPKVEATFILPAAP